MARKMLLAALVGGAAVVAGVALASRGHAVVPPPSGKTCTYTFTALYQGQTVNDSLSVGPTSTLQAAIADLEGFGYSQIQTELVGCA